MRAHGTRACYEQGCRQKPCCDAHRRYNKQWANATYATGKFLIDATPAAERIRAWKAQGWSCRQIAQAAGVAHTRISAIGRGACKVIHRDTAAKILAARPNVGSVKATTYVDATGSRRRVRALQAVGHTVGAIARAIGLSINAVGDIGTGKVVRVLAGTARAITDLYGRWSQMPGGSRFAVARARRERWAAPGDWLDTDMDDPSALSDIDPEPERGFRDFARARAAETLHLASFGVPDDDIAARTGLSVCRVREQITEARERLTKATLVPA